MTSTSPESVVRRFWEFMSANDFVGTGEVLADTFVAEWPQSNERIRGRSNYIRVNTDYPSHGRWVFTLHQLVASESQVVTDVSFTDGVQRARAISFFTVQDSEITHVIEYWPDNYSAPANRAHLVEPIA
jgi:ketosteroid isomerase-like protein